jgi:type IV fimbrial biogenesis protein FimT
MAPVFRYLHKNPENENVGKNSKMRGVTLLELLIALLIASVMLTMGIPSFRAVIDNQRMTVATNEMVMSLNLAKSEAIKRVAYVSVCKSNNGVACTGGSDWNDGWIVFANSSVANLGSIDVGDEVIRIYPALRQTIDLTPSGTIGDFLSFRPGGTVGTAVGNTSGTLTVCDERGAEHARGVLVEASGRWTVSRDLTHAGNALAC